MASVYRHGATISPLFLWALMTGGAGVYTLQVAMHRPPGSDARWVAILIAVLGFVFGPVAFVGHLLRLCLVTITVDPERGLVLSGRRTVPWAEVRSVRLGEEAFKGLIRANPFIFVYTAGCFALLYYIVLPACALFTPWHRRVIVELRSGEVIVFRDLRRADAFIREVSPLIPPEPRNGR